MKINRLLLVTAVFAISILPAFGQSSVLPRAEWKAEKPISADANQYRNQNRVVFLSVHQTESFATHPDFSEAALVKNVQWGHQNESPRLGDIAYHYIVGMSGEIYKGRNDGVAPGSKTRYLSSVELEDAVWDRGRVKPARGKVTSNEKPGNTVGHITVSFLCKDTLPSKGAKKAAVRLIAELLVSHNLTPAQVRFHREFANSNCPGDPIYGWMRGKSMNIKDRGEGLKDVETLYRSLKGTH